MTMVPRHLSFVLDGNRRWAKANNLPSWEGHMHALDAIENLLRWSLDARIEYLTLYVFSTENWSRAEEELAKLFGNVANKAIETKFPVLIELGAQVNVFGSLDRFPAGVKKAMDKLVADTAGNDKIVLNLCMDYGGRKEIVGALKKIVEAGTDASAITEELVSQNLEPEMIPDPDMMIRTGGAQRLSNFLLWQQAYTELYFVDKFLPDFTAEDFADAVKWYGVQERRLGK